MAELYQIKVFGERNTATRAVIRMIDAADGLRGAGRPGVRRADLAPLREMSEQVLGVMNGPWRRVYREAVNDLKDARIGPVGAWKHSAPRYHADFRTYDVRVLFTVRNPYSWILSLFKRPYHFLGPRQTEFETFLRFPWMTMGRDHVDKVLMSPMDLWSKKLGAYQSFEAEALAQGTRVSTMRFEDFVQDPALHLGEALKPLVDVPVQVEELASPTKKGGLAAAERRSYYGSEGWRSGLSTSSVAFINERVNWDIAARYGYARLDPSDFDG